MSVTAALAARLAEENNVTVTRNQRSFSYEIRKGGALIVNLPEAFINRDKANPVTRGELLLKFSAAFDGVSPQTIRSDRAEVERRAGDVYCRLGLWGPD